MITFCVSAVLAIRDGFTGAALSPSSVLCTLDGRRIKPVYKDGGYFVFCNLPEGEHELVLSGAYYRDERVALSVQPETASEYVVTMKPNARYPFGVKVTRLELQLTRGGKSAAGAVWMAVKSAVEEVKLAQDSVEPGDISARLFTKGGVQTLSLPRNYLLCDGKSTELCRLDGTDGETGIFPDGFKNAHKRGKSLYPAQFYASDEQGVIRAVFRESVELALFPQDGTEASDLALKPGDNTAELAI